MDSSHPTKILKPMIQPTQPFRVKYRFLVWSNPDAPDEIYIRRALLKPGIDILLDACVEYGLEEVERQWGLLLAEDEIETQRAKETTSRLMRNIRHGFEKSQR